MSVTRDISKIVMAVPEYWVFTCSLSTGLGLVSTGGYVYTTTSLFSATLGATATCGIDGHVINRLGPELGANFSRADVYAYLRTCAGSSEIAALKHVSFGVILEHATASGGTFVDFSTDNWPGLRYVNSCAETTPMYGHSTDNIDYLPSKPWSVDIRAAKQFLRATILTQRNTISTSTIGMEGYRVGAAIAFRGADYLAFRANTTGAFSTSTSTST